MAPLALPLSFSKSVIWALSRFFVIEPENSNSVTMPVLQWIFENFEKTAACLKWDTPKGCDDGAEGGSRNSIKTYLILSDSNQQLMYDAGIYAGDDDESEMSSFMGEMATSTKEVDSTESLDELKAMFLNIADTDCHKPASSKERASDCLSQNADEKHWRSMPPSDRGSTHEGIFMEGFCSDVIALDGGLNDIFEEGDVVDSLQELKQMFTNIVDPVF